MRIKITYFNLKFYCYFQLRNFTESMFKRGKNSKSKNDPLRFF